MWDGVYENSITGAEGCAENLQAQCNVLGVGPIGKLTARQLAGI
jgi:hypothetical protein